MTLNSNSFQDVTNSAGINWSRQRGDEAFSIAWVDFNNDGLLDLWQSGHGYIDAYPQNPTGKFPYLYINNGDGTFRNLFNEDWRQGSNGDTHGTAWIDFDNDGDRDVFVSGGGELGEGDGQPNLFFVNNGGTLQEETVARNLEYRIGRSRSSTWLDVNGDGRLDLIQLTASREDGKGESAYFEQNSDGTFKAPVPLVSDSSYYAQLGDLNGDGSLELIIQGTYQFPLAVYDVSNNSLQNITDNFNFPLTSDNTPDPYQDFFNRTSARDSIIADFDNDGDNDFFLTRSDIALNNDTPSVFQSGDRIIGAELLNEGSEIGFSFQTSGDIALDIFDIFEREPELSAAEIFIGSSGRNPTNEELAAFSSTDTATSVNLLKNNIDRPSLALSPDSYEVTGIKSNRSDRGIYVGYDDPTDTWQVLLSSNESEILRSVVESTADISNLTPINFSNPNPASRALTDQLWLNDSKDGNFVNVSDSAGFNFPTLSQSAVSGDFDNDKDLDIYIANAYTSIDRPNILYDNQRDGTFDIVPQAGGATGTEVGPLHLDFNTGERLITGDYDRDGFLDIFAGSTIVKSPRKTYLGTPPQLFNNQGNTNNWIQLDLEGTESNRDGIGAQVRLTSGGVTQLREQNGGFHAFAQNSPWLHFGLGDDEIIDRIEIRWSSGILQTLDDVAVNQVLTVKENESSPEPDAEPELNADPELNTNDNLVGTDSNDTLSGSNGDDTIIGGAGIDVLEEQINSDITISDGQLLARGTDFFSEIEIVSVKTGSSQNIIDASAVTDLQVNIESSNGSDTIMGGSQNDTIIGGTGIDVISGGDGEDIFIYQNVNQGDDIITDFQPEQDKILVSAAGFEGGLTLGNVDVEQFTLGAIPTDNSDRFLYDTNNGKLLFDSDGTGSADKVVIATLENKPLINAEDIEIIA